MHSLRPRKSLGQHFLRDENIARKIVSAIDPQPGDVMVEIGPGEGALTSLLAGRVRWLVAVEIDRRAAAVVRESFGGRGVEVREEDFLVTDLTALAGWAGDRLRIVGNIPYNITSPILFHVLDHRGAVRDSTLMMQREVARRLVAQPRTKDYGILSVLCQFYADVTMLFDVRPGAFVPRPAVTSSVVRLTPLRSPRCAVADEDFFRSMVRGVFGKRRKTLRNSLTAFLGERPAENRGTIDLGQRPEELSVSDLARLSNELFRHLRTPAHA